MKEAPVCILELSTARCQAPLKRRHLRLCGFHVRLLPDNAPKLASGRWGKFGRSFRLGAGSAWTANPGGLQGTQAARTPERQFCLHLGGFHIQLPPNKALSPALVRAEIAWTGNPGGLHGIRAARGGRTPSRRRLGAWRSLDRRCTTAGANQRPQPTSPGSSSPTCRPRRSEACQTLSQWRKQERKSARVIPSTVWSHTCML